MDSLAWDVKLLKVNGRFNSAVGLIAACREAEVHIVSFLVLLKKHRVLLVFLCYLLIKLFLTDILPKVLHISIEP